MIKEIKYFIFLLLILLFLFLTGRYYFSDTNKKNSYRSLSSNNQKIETYSKNLPILEDDTKDIINVLKEQRDNIIKNIESQKIWGNECDYNFV